MWLTGRPGMFRPTLSSMAVTRYFTNRIDEHQEEF